MLGRFFTAEELRQGPASGQALISHSLWQRRFAARSDVLGQTLTLNGEPRTVVGVMPRGFRFPYEAEIWVPIRYQPDDAANHYLLTSRGCGTVCCSRPLRLDPDAPRISGVPRPPATRAFAWWPRRCART